MLTKKYIFIGIFAWLISSLAIAGDPPAEHPKTGESLVIDCFRGTPVIDGKLNDWVLDFLTPAVLDTEEQIYPGAAQGAAAWDDPEDCSGEFYLLWDDDNIYIASVVKDEKLSMQKAGGNIWNADCIEIFFSTTNAIGGCTEHYQWGYNSNNQIWNWCNMDGNGQREPDYLQIDSSETDDGYICEVAFEYSNIKSLDFKAGNAIGFHPCIDDADPGADRDLQMTWTGREAHDQSLGFGHMILSSDNMPVYAKGKLSLTWGAIKNQ